MLTSIQPATKAKSNPASLVAGKPDRNLRRERRLWHDPERKISSLGCMTCPERNLCGGLRPKAAFYDCLQFCCGKLDGCDRVCRNHPDYPDRVREVATFDLGTVPRALLIVAPDLPHVVPVIYHRSARNGSSVSETVSLSLYSLFDRRSGQPRYASHNSLCKAFGIRPGSTIVLTGTDRDPPLERWWELGGDRRRTIIRATKAVGIGLVTTPNYSLFIDRPRWDNFHAMKRIAITHEEFLREGVAAALHVNGRTESDFSRWAAYIAVRPEITHLAYEFTTGTSWAGRQEQHARWLAGLAVLVGRPLHLVVRGGVEVLPLLARAFAGTTMLDTSIFIKTMKRQRAYAKTNSALGWTSSPTEYGAPLDDLFTDNYQFVEAWISDIIASSVEGQQMT